MGRAAWFIGVLLAALALAPGAEARPLSGSERASLEAGKTVTVEETITRGDARYVGGITYTLLDATPEELEGLFDDVSSYARVLPKTKQATLVGQNGPDRFVEVHQGNAFVDATYTIRLRRADDAREVRFWLDSTKPHAIADAWGFFRYEPTTDAHGNPKVLLTYGILVDLGPGIVRDLFEERVRGAMLGVPDRLRAYLSRGSLRRIASTRP